MSLTNCVDCLRVPHWVMVDLHDEQEYGGERRRGGRFSGIGLAIF